MELKVSTALTQLLMPWLIPYLTEVNDVLGDCHCGFRAIALAVGRQEDNHMTVRQDLLKDLDNQSDLYNQENLLWTPEEARLRINTDLDNVLHDRSLWLCMPHCG